MKKTMKKILVALLVCSILMMSGCTSRTESESDPRPATEKSSDTQAENEEVIEEEEPQSSENETNDEDQQPSGSETSENPDENSASTQSADADSFLYENSELGFLYSCLPASRKMQNSPPIPEMITEKPSTSSLLPIRVKAVRLIS